MQSETKKQSVVGTWSSSVAVVCLALMLGFASTGYGDIILGNFEHADSNDGWIPGSEDLNAVLVPDSNIGVTLGHGSLKVKPVAVKALNGTDDAYWRLQWSGSPLDLTDANLQFDLTMVASEWPSMPWTKVTDKIAINSDGPSGWKEYNNLAVATNRDTGEATSLDWGAWAGDANKTYTLNVSDYDATGATWMQIAVSVQDGNVVDGGNFYFDNMRLITPAMIVSKCKVTAGKTQYENDGDYDNMKDAFEASGTVVLPADLNDINSVAVTITSVTDGEVIYTETLDFSKALVRSGKFNYTHGVLKGRPGAIIYLFLDFNKGTFKIKAKNIDLTGLACPFEVKFTMGNYELNGNAYEAVVNGTKTIPTRLMRMYKDTLIVTKAKAKASTKASSDTLSVTGEIAVRDINTTQPNLYNIPVVITWSDKDDVNNVQTFTIPIHSFKIPKTGHLYKCSKINVDPNASPDVNDGIVTATIDLDKCTFAVSMAKANINAVSGDVKFGLRFADFNETDDYTLP